MSKIIDFNAPRYDLEAAKRGYERLMDGELSDANVDDTLTRDYDFEEFCKVQDAMAPRKKLGSVWAGTLFEDPEFVKTLNSNAGLSPEEKAEMDELEAAYMASFNPDVTSIYRLLPKGE